MCKPAIAADSTAYGEMYEIAFDGSRMYGAVVFVVCGLIIYHESGTSSSR